MLNNIETGSRPDRTAKMETTGDNFSEDEKLVINLIKNRDTENPKDTDEAILQIVKNSKSLGKEVAIKLLDAGQAWLIDNYIDSFTGLDLDIALKIIKNDPHSVFSILRKPSCFQGVVLDSKMADLFIETGNGSTMLPYLNNFHNLNYQSIAERLIKNNETWYVAENIDNFKELKPETIKEAFDCTFQIVKEQQAEIIEEDGCDAEDLSNAIKYNIDILNRVNKHSPSFFDKSWNKAFEIYGFYVDLKTCDDIKKVEQNDQNVIEKLGLRAGGADGLREIQETIRRFKIEMIKEDFDPEILISNKSVLTGPFFKSYIRYNESQWGNHEEGSFDLIVKNYIDSKNSGEIRPLNPNFKPSDYIDIKKSDDEARERYVFKEHFLNRFKTLVSSIEEAKKLYLNKFPITELVSRIENKRLELIAELKDKAEKMTNLKAKEATVSKIASLEEVNIRNLKNFQDNFSVISKNKEFNEDLREAVFLMGFAKNRQMVNRNLEKINLDKPEIDDISWVLNFVDHITNHETMNQYFTNEQSLKAFNELISTKAIREEMAAFQNQGVSKNTTKIQFIPTRAILAEFSGHIADACWASKYDCLTNNFPNFTAVIIRQNPETKYERLSGSFMLIETQSSNNEPLLIIRGLNPIENFINSVSVNDFYNNVKKYVTELAQKAGRKVAIVIDDHAGGAATNRPALFEYLKKLKLEKIELMSDSDTNFNGYYIMDSVSLVE